MPSHDPDWFVWVQTIGIVASLLFAAYSIRQATKVQKLTMLFQLTQYHRDIWSVLFDQPALTRVLDEKADAEQALTEAERVFVSLLVLHLSCAFEASRAGVLVPIERMEKDVREFFRLPIPARVWKEMRGYQNQTFIAFVDAAVKHHKHRVST